MTRVWLLYDRSKPLGIFLVLVFVSGLSIGLPVNRYPPGVSIVSLPLRLSHFCSSADRAMSLWLRHVRLLITNLRYGHYVLVCLFLESLSRSLTIKHARLF